MLCRVLGVRVVIRVDLTGAQVITFKVTMVRVKVVYKIGRVLTFVSYIK